MTQLGRPPTDVIERLEANSIPLPETGCWVWLGATVGKGYGYILESNQISQLAHRISYKRFNGQIPDGCDVHHTCEIRCCWNPAHLTLLPKSEHGRMHTPKGRQFEQVQCPHCKKIGNKPPMLRWHFANCKLNVEDFL